eukprot:scaffold5520_cov167-Amphora_coffeaeformis.AAC.12
MTLTENVSIGMDDGSEVSASLSHVNAGIDRANLSHHFGQTCFRESNHFAAEDRSGFSSEQHGLCCQDVENVRPLIGQRSHIFHIPIWHDCHPNDFKYIYWKI